MIQQVIDGIVYVDKVLNSKHNQSSWTNSDGDKKSEKETAKTNEEIQKAQNELDKNKSDKAIDRFEKAWKHTQKAVKEGFDDDDDD